MPLVSTITCTLLLVANVALGAASVSGSVAQETASGDWTQIDIPGLNDGTWVYSVRRADDVILVGTNTQGLFRSEDGGGTWDEPQYDETYVRDLWLSGDNALAATLGSGLLRSENAGTNWDRVRQNFNTDYFYSLIQAGDWVYVGTADRGVWKWEHSGDTWVQTTSFNSPGAVSLAAGSDGSVYAGSVNNGLYRTTDEGGNWQRVGFTGETVRAVAVDPYADWVYASVLGDGVHRGQEENGGWVWVEINDDLPGTTVFSLLVPHAGTVLAGTEDHGVYRLSEDGTTWSPWALEGRNVPSLTDWKDTLYAGTDDKVWQWQYLDLTGKLKWLPMTAIHNNQR